MMRLCYSDAVIGVFYFFLLASSAMSFGQVNAGADRTICIGKSTTLGGSPAGGPPGITYSWLPSSSLSNPSAANPVATPASTTTYVLTVTNNTVSCNYADPQNIVPNASFETYTSCPAGYSFDPNNNQLIKAVPWNYFNGQTSDYFNCGISPTNFAGTQTAKSGTGYAGFFTYPNAREYLQAHLISSPVAGKRYKVCFYVSCSCDGFPRSVDGMGAYFSDTLLTWAPAGGVLPYTPQVSNPSGNILTNSTGWDLVSGVFTAKGTENYIIIGNFNSNANTQFIGGSGNDNSYYYIDDISVLPVNDTVFYAFDTVQVTVSDPFAMAGNNTIVCSGNNTTLGGSPTGPVQSTYSWSPASGLSNTTSANPIASPSATITYMVQVTDNAGCIITDTVTVTIPAKIINAGNDVTICPGANVSLSAALTGSLTLTPCAGTTLVCNNPAVATYGGTTNGSGFFSTTPYGNWSWTTDYRWQVLYLASDLQAAGVKAGIISSVAFYVLTKSSVAPFPGFTIKMGCTGLDQFDPFSGNPAIGGLTTVYNPKSYTTVAGWNTHPFDNLFVWDGASNIVIEVCWGDGSGTGPGDGDRVARFNTAYYSYWTIEGTGPGPAGCGLPMPITVQGKIVPSIRFGMCNPDPAYVWSPGTALSNPNISNPIANPVATTTYVVSIPGLMCPAKDTVVVIVNCGGLSVTSSNVSCNGQCTGTAMATPTSGIPPYTYSWSVIPAQTTQIVTGLCAGTYSVLVTDAASSTTAATVAITQPAIALTATISSTPQTCALGGAAMANPSGGTAPYTYQWCNGQTTSSATGLSAGSCTVIVTEANGCIVVSSATIITSGNIPSVSAASSPATCGSSNGSATAAASGGTAPYAYNWNNGQVTPTATGLSAGNYTVTVTDANGCTQTQTVNVSSNNPLIVSSFSTQTGCLIINGAATANPGNGTSPYIYSWNNGQTSQTATNLSAGTYTITVTDANGCSQTNTVTVTQTAGPVAAVVSNVSITQGQNATLTASGGGIYQWSNGSTDNPLVVAPAITTVYCITVTDANNCTDTACVTVAVTTEPADCSSAGELYLPNAFSPNGDGENDALQIYYSNKDCIEIFKLVIYNRWGEMVFESFDQSKGWNGIFKGKIEDTGVFVWHLNMALSNGEKINRKGNVSLIR